MRRCACAPYHSATTRTGSIAHQTAPHAPLPIASIQAPFRVVRRALYARFAFRARLSCDSGSVQLAAAFLRRRAGLLAGFAGSLFGLLGAASVFTLLAALRPRARFAGALPLVPDAAVGAPPAAAGATACATAT